MQAKKEEALRTHKVSNASTCVQVSRTDFFSDEDNQNFREESFLSGFSDSFHQPKFSINEIFPEKSSANPSLIKPVNELPDFTIPENLGPNPCSVYCPWCSKYVNTRLSLQKKSVSLYLLNYLSQLFECCNNSWLTSKKVHCCEECGVRLGNVI